VNTNDDPGILAEAAMYDGDIEKATDSLVLREAMKILTPEENQIVLLHLYSGLKHRETAKILGIPPGTVGRRYSEAINKLKSSVTPDYISQKNVQYSKISNSQLG